MNQEFVSAVESQGTTICLNDMEKVLCALIAKERMHQNRSNGVRDRKKAKYQSAEMIELDGIGAEVAFCKLCNYYPDMSSHPRSGGHDCLTGDGLRVDVKHTRYKEGRLIAIRTKTAEDADIYVLMRGTFPVFKFCGWCYAEELLDESNLMDLGMGLTFVLPNERLRGL